LVEDTRNSVVRYERTLLNLNPIYKSCGGQCRTLRREELSTINYPLSTISPVVGSAAPYEERNYQLSTINSFW